MMYHGNVHLNLCLFHPIKHALFACPTQFCCLWKMVSLFCDLHLKIFLVVKWGIISFEFCG